MEGSADAERLIKRGYEHTGSMGGESMGRCAALFAWPETVSPR
jgi:hypothetical protein